MKIQKREIKRSMNRKIWVWDEELGVGAKYIFCTKSVISNRLGPCIDWSSSILGSSRGIAKLIGLQKPLEKLH